MDKAAALTRVSKSMLSDYQNASMMETFMAVDVMADLEHFVGEPILSGLLAERAEGDGEPHSPAEKVHRIGRMAKEVGEAVEAFANGDSEAAIKEIDEAIAELEAAKRDILARRCGPREVRDAG
ncbi:hypothetical protein HBA54_27280 [Pelagibius litoralis]|uniref:Uncharacterized protein n=1 Tax=Pelagibius litoralis TaxID=374515 RepID=A0A967KBQ9_9PROT|nr:hypothetical protein [Pelagibius litoralis]NIA72298.1 hypothetical protein [Pelagibius litoralis]